MGIIAWIIFGGLAGWIASMLAGNNAQQGILGNVTIGIIGALIGGFIFEILGGKGITGFNIWSMLVAIFGAVLLLIILKPFRSRT